MLSSTLGQRPVSTVFPYTTLFRSGVPWHPAPYGVLGQLCPGATTPDERPAGVQQRGPYLVGRGRAGAEDRKSTRLNSSHTVISYAVFCLKKKKKHENQSNARTVTE